MDDRPEQGDSPRLADQAGRDKTSSGVIRWARREVLGVLVVAVSLFSSAGRIDWPMGWALVAIYAVWSAAQAAILVPRSPELLAERGDRSKAKEAWDIKLLAMIGLLTLTKHIVAGLDLRYGWTTGLGIHIARGVQVTSLVVAASGYALGTWAMVVNAFFSLVGRVQTGRGQAVVSAGPYRFVRHPGYVGVILFELTTPVMLGSTWAIIPGVLTAALTVARTAGEDRMLQADLAGYADYAKRTRFRLLPGVW